MLVQNESNEKLLRKHDDYQTSFGICLKQADTVTDVPLHHDRDDMSSSITSCLITDECTFKVIAAALTRLLLYMHIALSSPELDSRTGRNGNCSHGMADRFAAWLFNNEC